MKNICLILFLALLLTACGGTKTVKPSPVPAATPAPQPQTQSGKKGGYYLDDGPGENAPADIDSIPDAIPHAEQPLNRANRPYSALGTKYTPMTEYVPYKEVGVASWYGKRYHGQKTSSGEIYDMYGMTGAHTTLPLPSYARVTNTTNGRSVIVRINDRGPFHSDRIIDLSYAAAYKLRLHEKGSGIVQVEAIDTRVSSMIKGPATQVQTPLPIPTPTTTPVQIAAPAAMPESDTSSQPTLQLDTSPPVVASTEKITAASVATKAAEDTNEMISGDYMQVAAFKTKANAESLVTKIKQQALNEGTPVFSWYNNDVYKVRVGPYASRAEAEQASKKLGPALNVKPVIVHIP